MGNESKQPVRKLGRGLAALMAQPVAITLPREAAEVPSAEFRVPSGKGKEVLSAEVRVPSGGGKEVASGEAAAGGGERIVEIAVGLIVPNRHQPRVEFDEARLAELADSIRKTGVMQPLLVRRACAEMAKLPNGQIAKLGGGGGVGEDTGRKTGATVGGGGVAGQYELISGERRWRAAVKAGLLTVPCIIKEVSDQESAEWALVENLQREDLGAVEKARAFARLTAEFGLSQSDIARQVSIDPTSVSNHLRLLDLEQPILGHLEAKRLTFGHGRALLGLAAVHVSGEPGKSRLAVAERAVREGWSVRRLETEVESLSGLKKGAKSGGEEEKLVGLAGLDAAAAAEKAARAALGRKSAEINRGAMEKQLGEQLGTKVMVAASLSGATGKTKGKLVVEFYSIEQFEGLLERMGLKVRI